MFDNVSSLGTVLGQTTVFGWLGTWAIYAKSSVCSWIIRNYIISQFTSFLLETMLRMELLRKHSYIISTSVKWFNLRMKQNIVLDSTVSWEWRDMFVPN
jgi:hypothetical protein